MNMLLLLAGIARCASADFCPTDQELRAALRAQSDASEWAILKRHYAENPDEILFLSRPRILKLSNVLCGEADRDEVPISVMCAITVRYPGRDSYRIVKLVRQDGEWAISESMGFLRDR